MQVRPRGSPRISDESEELAAVHLLSWANQKFIEMAKGGFVAVAVVNEDIIAIRAIVERLVNVPVGGGVDIVPRFAAKVDARMEGRFAIDRVNAFAELGANGAIDRPTEGQEADGFQVFVGPMEKGVPARLRLGDKGPAAIALAIFNLLRQLNADAVDHFLNEYASFRKFIDGGRQEVFFFRLEGHRLFDAAQFEFGNFQVQSELPFFAVPLALGDEFGAGAKLIAQFGKLRGDSTIFGEECKGKKTGNGQKKTENSGEAEVEPQLSARPPQSGNLALVASNDDMQVLIHNSLPKLLLRAETKSMINFLFAIGFIGLLSPTQLPRKTAESTSKWKLIS